MSVETADAVVIGAGHNGLVAANLLTDAGWSVLVLEATGEPGGAVRSAPLPVPGFSTDLCSAFFPLSAVSPAMKALELERHGLRWRHAPEVLAHIFPDDRCALLSRDLKRTQASVAAFAPEDADAWEAMFQQWQRIRDALVDSLLTPFPPVRAGARLLRSTGTAEALRLARMLMLPARRLGMEAFRGDGARLLLAGNALHADVGIDNAGSGVFGWLLAMLAQDVGFPVPEGGASEITAALVRRLASRGGRIECGRRVTGVLVANGRALGVRDHEGVLVRAGKAVLADVPAPTLYLDLVGAEQLPSRLVGDLEVFEWDSSTVKVDWALSGPVPWTAEEAREAGTLHLGADLNGLSRFSTDLVTGRIPRNPFLLLGQMTTADPARSPAGTASVWAYTHVPRGSCRSESALAHHVQRIEERIEKHAPGFTGLILDRLVHGPASLEQHDPSLVGGAINAGTTAIHQQLFLRPTPGLGRADTPIDRLFLASASAHPGGAVHGGPGSNAARAALARAGHAGALYSTTVKAAQRLVHGR
ncbi:Phytoene dehydrogenase-related protein [Amycolatopsis xylanica]|uniref:Pyridine nucleotide-disulfide oxidoreductase domain-containing protein 2 n=1 Tax=Amycolatopsis xylanica TaxID=589385 RepID=A0A1H3S8K6_9PSEU|nr:NAD(P)/FAD-dependent oxidoreductase [Amycolatopsis xylanica]SDZ34366.1 Phytoene dehydrogenase-related protein [Amycolatopsis xylanica]